MARTYPQLTEKTEKFSDPNTYSTNSETYVRKTEGSVDITNVDKIQIKIARKIDSYGSPVSIKAVDETNNKEISHNNAQIIDYHTWTIDYNTSSLTGNITIGFYLKTGNSNNTVYIKNCEIYLYIPEQTTEITFKSTPSAKVYVDGVYKGTT